MRLPTHISEAVSRKLFDDMRAIGWEGLTAAERTRQYARWVEDSDVGGLLIAFMSSASARVWIKDGPAKEYQRTLAGVGKYSAIAGAGSTHVNAVVHHALGDEWNPDLNTIGIKPIRVTARNADLDAVVTWGPLRDLKHLAWAALTAQAEGDAREWVIVVTSSFTRPATTADKLAHTRLSKRLNLRIRHLELS